MEELEYLRMIEAVLTGHRAFGDSDYIHQQLESCYGRRLDTLSRSLPIAGELLNVLSSADKYSRRHVIGDTVVRCAIDHMLLRTQTPTQHGLPPDECEAVLRATVRHVTDGKPGGLLEYGAAHVDRLLPGAYHSWIWNEQDHADVLGRAFRHILREDLGESLCSLDGNELANLSAGAQLLHELVPSLSFSALGHAHVIAVFPSVGFWRGKASVSKFQVAGTIFLSREHLHNPWWVAEHLLHEALHQKLYDFRRGHSLFETHMIGNPSRICALWNLPSSDRKKSNCWDTFRAVAAFHVYVQLALLAQLAEARATDLQHSHGPRRGMIAWRKAMDRARYLGEQLQELCWPELGLAGKRLVEWLVSVLDALDPAPPARGARIHLLLDRYYRESNLVESKIRSCCGEAASGDLGNEATASAHLPRRLMEIIEEEVHFTRLALAEADAWDDLSRFDNAFRAYSDDELGMKFPEVRGLISEAITHASLDGAQSVGNPVGSRNPRELVRQMVENSSRHLEGILA